MKKGTVVRSLELTDGLIKIGNKNVVKKWRRGKREEQKGNKSKKDG